MPTQAEVTTLALAEAARQAQVRMRRELALDVTHMWRVLDFEQLQQTWPVWIRAMTAALTRTHRRAADDGALFYRATRQFEVGDPGVASLASPPTEEWVSRALGYAAPGTYDRQIRAKATPERANRSALVQTLGTASRIVMDGHRATVVESVKADPIAKGWYRVTDGDPCAFCALMASRGPVYKTEDTAGRGASDQFTGAGEFKWHNDCGCTVAPSFSSTHTLGPVAQEAADIYLNRGKGDALTAFRKAWNNRHAT